MISLAVLGFAHGHVHALLSQWAEHPEYEVKAVAGWDRNEESQKENCEKYGLKMLSLEEILSDTDIKAVLICAETAYHCELAVQAAEAKKKIILYKPMAVKLRDSEKIVKAVEANGVDFTAAFQMRCDPVNIEMKEKIDSGEMGKCFYFRRRHGLSSHLWGNFENSWHVDPALNRDIFADDAAHPVDLILWLFGMPRYVSCEISTARRNFIKNDTAVAVMRYDSGLLCEVSFSAVCSAAEITTEAYFEDGAMQHYGGDQPAAAANDGTHPAIRWYKNADKKWTDSALQNPEGQHVRIAAQAKPLAEFLNGKRPPLCTAREAHDALRIVLACCQSSVRGSRVSPEDPSLFLL
ncbi:MAG: Gfo/Idh/MocA family oxidoreductase [Clostridia bacterium]|nr:Gfo/Idh/MocA family oxidoreductase [Clostridia bacterium]